MGNKGVVITIIDTSVNTKSFDLRTNNMEISTLKAYL